MITNFKVWQYSMDLVVEVYELGQKLPKYEMYGTTVQTQRSVVSILSNIAEGFRRGGNNEFARFLKISSGSCGELDTQLEIIERI